MILRESTFYCPHCKKTLSRTEASSGNTIGAKFWSDGKVRAPMLLTVNKIIRCPKCNDIFWREDAKECKTEEEATEISDNSFFPENSLLYNKPINTINIFSEALEKKLGNNLKKEKYLRVGIWRSYNDFIRRYSTESSFKSFLKDIFSSKKKYTEDDVEKWIEKYFDLYTNNLQKLLLLLNENYLEDIVQKIEILRNLSKFEQAKELLDNHSENIRNNQFVKGTQQAIRNKNPYPFLLNRN